jgi:hypothetical protein
VPQYTLAPRDGIYNNYQFDGATNVGYIADASDGTVVNLPNMSDVNVYAALTAPGSPSGELVAVVPAVRAACSTGGFLRIGVARRDGSTWATRELATPTLDGNQTDLTAAPRLGDILLWGLSDVADAYIYVHRGIPRYDQTSIAIAKAGGVAYYLAGATVAAPSAPSGTVAVQRPEQAVTVSSLVESWQQDGWLCGHTVEMAVYRSADVTGADPPVGITPDWSSTERVTLATYGDGTTPSTQAVTMTPDVGLEDTDYITFARVSRDLPAGQGLNWSAWTKSAAAWTVDAGPPAAPTTVTAVADDDVGSVAITVTAPTTAGYETAATCRVQRSDDLGVTWADVVNMDAVPITLGGGATAMGLGYLAPAGSTTLQYRARITAQLSPDGAYVESAWTTITGIHGPALFAGWRFIPMDEPTSTWSGAKVVGPFEEGNNQPRAVFEPIDGSLHKVVTGQSCGRTGKLSFWANGATEAASLDALLRQTGVVLMTTGFGDTRFIAWSSNPTWRTTGTQSNPYREATIDYVETDSPA